MWVFAEDTEYPHDLPAPASAGFEPNQVSSEAPKDAHTEHKGYIQLTASRQGSSSQQEKSSRNRKADLPGKYGHAKNQIGESGGVVKRIEHPLSLLPSQCRVG